MVLTSVLLGEQSESEAIRVLAESLDSRLMSPVRVNGDWDPGKHPPARPRHTGSVVYR